MTGSLSCVWNDFPCYVVKNRKTTHRTSMTLGSGSWCSGEIGIRGRFAHKILVICCTMVVIVSTKNCERGDMSSLHIHIIPYPYGFVCEIQYSQFQWIMIWLIISILMKKNMFFHFQFTQRQIFPRSDRWWSSLWDSVRLEVHLEMLEPPKSSQVCISFPIQKLDHLRQRAKSPHLGA